MTLKIEFLSNKKILIKLFILLSFFLIAIFFGNRYLKLEDKVVLNNIKIQELKDLSNTIKIKEQELKDLSNTIKIKENESLQLKLNRIFENINEIKIFFEGEDSNFIDNKEIIIKKFNFYDFQIFDFDNVINGRSYIDRYKSQLYIINEKGFLYSSDINNFFNNSNFKLNKIKSNIFQIIQNKNFYLSNKLGIKDMIIHDGELYISVSNFDETLNCAKLNIYTGALNNSEINFEKFWDSGECVFQNNKHGEFDLWQTGGRMIINDENLFLSTGEYRNRDLAQNPDSIYGKLLMINMNNKEHKIIASGLRNPQGLYLDSINNSFYMSDHGPHGGDEINRLNFEPIDNNAIANFGWPISSYGKHYPSDDVEEKYLKAPLYKSHSKYNFIEPLLHYIPSIAPSQLIILNSKPNRLLIVSSMKGELILYLIKENGKLEKFQSIKFDGKRLRDLYFDDSSKRLIIYNESDPGFITINLSNIFSRAQ